MGRYLLRLLCSATYLVLLAGMISGMGEIWFGWSLLLVDVLLAAAAWLVHRGWFQRLARRLSGRSSAFAPRK